MDNSLSGSLETLFSKMEQFITTKTVVGQPVEIGGIIIIPLVDVVFGVGAGNSAGGKNREKAEDSSVERGSAGGLGAKMTPSAVLVIQKDGTVQLVNIKNQDSINKLIDMVPGVLNKLNFDLFQKKKDGEDEKKEPSEEKALDDTHISESFE